MRPRSVPRLIRAALAAEDRADSFERAHRYGLVERALRLVRRRPRAVLAVVVVAALATVLALAASARASAAAADAARARADAARVAEKAANQKRGEAERAKADALAIKERSHRTALLRARFLIDGDAPMDELASGLTAIVDADPHGLGPVLALIAAGERRISDEVSERLTERIARAGYETLPGEWLILASRFEARRGTNQDSPAPSGPLAERAREALARRGSGR